ncbi:MAG TPA: CDP-alcohol phosphatidyltransferase family protein [Allosphingosinicella sp.]|jgi:hypothetical protein
MSAVKWLPAPDGSRDPRIEDPTNLYIVHLSGRALLPLALRLHIPANLVSLSGLALGAGGAAAFYGWRDWRLACLGLLLCTCWMIADGLDGMIARASRTTSAFGRFLDGVCDHLVFVLLYCALAASLETASAWTLAFAAGAAHALQATLYEGERTRFHRRLKGSRTAAAPSPAPANPFVRVYDAVAGSFDKAGQALEDRMHNPADGAGIKAAYLRRAIPPLRLMALLTNNMRVLMIFAACLIGRPALFWWAEVTVSTAILVLGLVWLRSAERIGLEADGRT